MSAFNLKTILVPVDFSESSERAVEVAQGLAAKFDAKLVLLHAVYLPAPAASIPAAELGASFQELTRYAADWAQGELKTLREKMGLPEAEGRVREGEPVSVVLEEAEAVGASLVVMGTHGRTGLSRLFMGSVAERVVRGAPCPVLTVRDDYS